MQLINSRDVASHEASVASLEAQFEAAQADLAGRAPQPLDFEQVPLDEPGGARELAGGVIVMAGDYFAVTDDGPIAVAASDVGDGKTWQQPATTSRRKTK